MAENRVITPTFRTINMPLTQLLKSGEKFFNKDGSIKPGITIVVGTQQAFKLISGGRRAVFQVNDDKKNPRYVAFNSQGTKAGIMVPKAESAPVTPTAQATTSSQSQKPATTPSLTVSKESKK